MSIFSYKYGMNLEEGTDVYCDDVRAEWEERERSGKNYHRS